MRRCIAPHVHAYRHEGPKQEGSGLVLAVNPAQAGAVVGTLFISDLALR